MNVLMLGRELPGVGRGPQAAREHRFARFLGASHHLTLAFVTDEPEPGWSVSALRNDFADIEFAVVPRAWKALSGAVRLAAGGSCTMTYYHSEALTTRLAARMRAERYDLIYVSTSGMIRYALEMDPTVPLVMDFGAVDSDWWSRQAEARIFPGDRFCRTESIRLRAAETAVARRARRCVVSSAEAARVLASFAPWAPTTVIPDGFAPGADAPGWEDAQRRLARVLAEVVGPTPPPDEASNGRAQAAERPSAPHASGPVVSPPRVGAL